MWFCAVLITPCSAGLAELPITNNPDEFGSQDANHYPILTIKADINKFLFPSNSSLQSSDYLLIRADTRLSFGEVRRTLQELKKYRNQGIILMAEQQIVEPTEISPFEEYLFKRSYCGC